MSRRNEIDPHVGPVDPVRPAVCANDALVVVVLVEIRLSPIVEGARLHRLRDIQGLPVCFPVSVCEHVGEQPIRPFLDFLVNVWVECLLVRLGYSFAREEGREVDGDEPAPRPMRGVGDVRKHVAQ